MKRILFVIVTLLTLSSCAYRKEIASEEAGLFFHQGLKAYYLGDAPYAEDCFKRVIARDRDNDAAFFYLSRLAFFRENKEASDEYLQKAIRLQPQNYWYRLQAAKNAVIENDIRKAETLYESLRGTFPHKNELLYDMINLYINDKQNPKALSLLDTLEQREGKTESGVLLRFNFIVKDQPEKAIELLKEYTAENPTPRVLCVMGDYYAGGNLIEEAMICYQRSLEMDPTFMPALFGEAEVYRMKRQFDLFFEHINPFLAYPDVDVQMKNEYLKQLIDSRGFVTTFQPQVDTMFLSTREAHPKDTTLAYMYAGYLIQTQRPKKAMEVVSDNIIYYSDNYSAWYQTLAVFYYLKEWDTLSAYSSAALKKFPDNVDFSSMHGLSLWQTGDVSGAINCFENILLLLKKEDKANRIQTLALLGDLYHEIGNSQKSFLAYDEVLKLDPLNVPVLNNYAYFLCIQDRDLEKALNMSKKTIEKEPNNSTYLDTYGWILHLLGRTAEARDILRQAVAYGGKESAEILNHYGDILNALNEPQMAIVYWQQAFALEPREEIESKIRINKAKEQ